MVINLVFLLLFIFSVYASSADLDVVDDGEGSIYNGDENHKVWSGSQDRLDSIGMESPYDIYTPGTSTLGRPARARQISAPVPVPPPPKQEEIKKMKDHKKSSSSKSLGTQSLSGTLIRPKPMMPNTHGRPHPMMHPGQMPPPHQQPMYAPMVHHPGGRQFHTYSHRRISGPPILHPHHMGPPHGIPMMMPQQYATLQPPRSKKNKKKDKMNGGVPIGMPVPTPLFYPPPAQILPESRPLSMSNRKLAQSAAAGLDDSGNSGAESPGTGIYRRKGHLNERAFSYSIRQEHRSRSHGSLASLQFNPPDMKKEREIAQMVAGLDLNGHDLSTLQRQRQQITTNGNGSESFGKPRR